MYTSYCYSEKSILILKEAYHKSKWWAHWGYFLKVRKKEKMKRKSLCCFIIVFLWLMTDGGKGFVETRWGLAAEFHYRLASDLHDSIKFNVMHHIVDEKVR